MAEAAITASTDTLKREYNLSLVEVSMCKINEKMAEAKLDQSSK